MPWEMKNPADVAGGAVPEYYLIPDPPRGDGDWPGVEPGQILTMPQGWDSNDYVSTGTYSAGATVESSIENDDVPKTNSYRPTLDDGPGFKVIIPIVIFSVIGWFLWMFLSPVL